MGIRHIALFRWADGVTEDQVAGVAAALSVLPAAVPQLQAYAFGPDVGISEGAYDFGVVADVADPEGFAGYRDHPEHQKALGVILPLLADRAAIQFRLPDTPGEP
ncbi:stress responsive alpha/beta barrel protein [Murinocardiopsis flavida]|uniref:Stress responsive alpha/beta barrel protein n=1 Tax=Murinocardiopsis flavida TaxID=645275 RepID=A0A2P8CVX6_9ACTN|nr:Dabb family protein [Murinocardiopsis flavida]PSK89128.1 stress responsive alpha/beta barrel protein [Murinocardiopsis flavida]